MMQLISTNGGRPLWGQVSDILCERIESGRYPVGEIMPGEAAIMSEFGVSRTTVRQAMEKLVSLGYVERQRGKGTIVLERHDKIETTMQSAFGGVLEKHNDHDRRVVSVAWECPPSEVAYFFDVLPDSRVLCLRRETVICGHVAAYFQTYLNPALDLNEAVDFSGSLYKLLESHGCGISSIVEKITADFSNKEDERVFSLAQSAAIMRRTRIGKSGETPVEYTFSNYLGKDYELTINLGSA